MAVIASVVVRNEAHRYLESCLAWNSQWWDELFVYDDQSTDTTREICSEYTDTVVVRPDGVPSFMEHEGRYRSAAWAALVERCNPTTGDWVFALDADEFLVGIESDVDLRTEVRCAVVGASMDSRRSVEFRIPDVWDFDETMIRLDGFWGSIERPELIRFQNDWSFRPKSMGCGSGPEYSFQRPWKSEQIGLLHYGHAHPEDRQERHSRYTSLPDHGHHPKHIASIISTPTLKKWTGQVPEVWRGRR